MFRRRFCSTSTLNLMENVISGSYTRTGIIDGNIRVNGSAKLGGWNTKTVVGGNFIVSGKLSAAHVDFKKAVEVNGVAELENSTFADSCDIKGQLTAIKSSFTRLSLLGDRFNFNDCVADSLSVQSLRIKASNIFPWGTKIILVDTIIKEDIQIQDPSAHKSEIILRGNSKILGKVMGAKVVDETLHQHYKNPAR